MHVLVQFVRNRATFYLVQEPRLVQPILSLLLYNLCDFYCITGAVLGKNIWGPGPSSFGRQQQAELLCPIVQY